MYRFQALIGRWDWWESVPYWTFYSPPTTPTCGEVINSIQAVSSVAVSLNPITTVFVHRPQLLQSALLLIESSPAEMVDDEITGPGLEPPEPVGYQAAYSKLVYAVPVRSRDPFPGENVHRCATIRLSEGKRA